MSMETEAAATMSSSRPPPALYLMRMRSRTSKVLDLDTASGPPTPPRRSPVGVPFLWEDTPGRPKLMREAAAGSAQPSAPAATARPPLSDGGAAGVDHKDSARARPVPLKLPPRLQAAAEYSLSPKTVLQGPYGSIASGNKPPRPLRRSGSTASWRRRAGASGSLFSWRKATAAAGSKKHGHDNDASCCSPSSSSSSSSMSYFGDDHGRGTHRLQAEDHEDPEEGEEGAKRSVRITRLRRNRSLPSLNASHLWASFRKSVRQITPWS